MICRSDKPDCRHSCASARSEVYLEDSGWTRVDPTSAVAPSRILGGIENALPESIIDVPLGLQNSFAARNIWRQFRDAYEAVNNGWNQWVLSYDQRKQINFFNKLGFGEVNWGALSFMLMICLGLLLAGFIYILIRSNQKTNDPVKKTYLLFCNRLSKIGIFRKPYEGPMDFAKRAGSLRGDLKTFIDDITAEYIAVRYANDGGRYERFKSLVADFKPGKQSTA